MSIDDYHQIFFTPPPNPPPKLQKERTGRQKLGLGEQNDEWPKPPLKPPPKEKPLPRTARPSLSDITWIVPNPMLVRLDLEIGAECSSADAVTTMLNANNMPPQMIPKFLMAGLLIVKGIETP
jgi:hypothetical protein